MAVDRRPPCSPAFSPAYTRRCVCSSVIDAPCEPPLHRRPGPARSWLPEPFAPGPIDERPGPIDFGVNSRQVVCTPRRAPPVRTLFKLKMEIGSVRSIGIVAIPPHLCLGQCARCEDVELCESSERCEWKGKHEARCTCDYRSYRCWPLENRTLLVGPCAAKVVTRPDAASTAPHSPCPPPTAARARCVPPGSAKHQVGLIDRPTSQKKPRHGPPLLNAFPLG